MRTFKSWGKKLVSPATTNAPDGMDWMDRFFAACGGDDMCGVDVIALHWYDTDVQRFKDYVTSWKKYGKPIWVTEMACENFSGTGSQCDEGQIWDLMVQTTTWMKADPQIEKYFWFGTFRDMTNVNPENCLMDPDTGKPNGLGDYYIN